MKEQMNLKFGTNFQLWSGVLDHHFENVLTF